jgi:hypothetical protein
MSDTYPTQRCTASDIQEIMFPSWQKNSITVWTRILKESVEAKDTEREIYARWMLDEVLKGDK